MKIFTCKYCGSDEVKRDALASWNTENQCWELNHVFDQAYCTQCDGETSIVKKEMIHSVHE
jgi:hypothetical protein